MFFVWPFVVPLTFDDPFFRIPFSVVFEYFLIPAFEASKDDLFESLFRLLLNCIMLLADFISAFSRSSCNNIGLNKLPLWYLKASSLPLSHCGVSGLTAKASSLVHSSALLTCLRWLVGWCFRSSSLQWNQTCPVLACHRTNLLWLTLAFESSSSWADPIFATRSTSVAEQVSETLDC